MSKVDRSVVRNQAYRKSEFNIRERHNERKNESYGNGDILPERFEYNVHYKTCDGTYEQEFNRMVDSDVVSLRGLKPDAKIFDEFVFDVNSGYFENNGGYDYAKEFFAEAYRLAVKEVGGEEYVLSAVLHADERNKALSEQYGYDVFHYHLHVVYVPVVDKEIYFKRNNKDPELAGKLKEVIKQVSHSKKWPRFKGENGHWVNSYSLLQDRFYEHMREAGYNDFERGERGSTTEHLSTTEFKMLKETERVAVLGAEIKEKEQNIVMLDRKTEKKTSRLDKLDEQITVKTKTAATIEEIDTMGKPAMLGGINVSVDEMKKLRTFAKKGITADKKVADMRRERDKAVAELDEEKKKRPSITGHLNWWEKFLSAMKRAPKRLMAVIEDILRQPPEQPEPERTILDRSVPERKRTQAEL